MDDSSAQQQDEPSKPAASAPSSDWQLAMLVDHANRMGLRFGVTLQMSGMLVCGTVIGGKDYFTRFAENFSKAYPGGPDDVEEIRQALSLPADLYTGDAPKTPVHFIHLEGVRFFSVTGDTPFVPVMRGGASSLWRGRLCEVQGWFLGMPGTQ